MPAEHTIVERSQQPYVAIRRAITMQTFNEIIDRIPEVFGWLGARGIEPVGAPFFKYNVIDMERELEVEAGLPVAAAVEADGDVLAGVLPAGRYVTVTHIGHPDELIEATRVLLEWAEKQGLEFDAWDTPAGHKWACRLELMNTDPDVEPDLTKWETELAFKLAD